MFERYLTAWGLTPDGPPLTTISSRLLPVRRHGVPGMLKIAVHPEEKSGAALMKWWDGHGAAPVLAHDDNALLLERADDSVSLNHWSGDEADDEGMRIMCGVIRILHTPRSGLAPRLVPLSRWFSDLLSIPPNASRILLSAAATARGLLNDSRDTVPLHGDIHHGNVLYFGQRGWLAIDPKGLIGERGFDYANMFCNPDLHTAARPDRFKARLKIVSEAADLERTRLAEWILAWTGLSAVWLLDEGSSPTTPLAIAELAISETGRWWL